MMGQLYAAVSWWANLTWPQALVLVVALLVLLAIVTELNR